LYLEVRLPDIFKLIGQIEINRFHIFRINRQPRLPDSTRPTVINCPYQQLLANLFSLMSGLHIQCSNFGVRTPRYPTAARMCNPNKPVDTLDIIRNKNMLVLVL